MDGMDAIDGMDAFDDITKHVTELSSHRARNRFLRLQLKLIVEIKPILLLLRPLLTELFD